MVLEDGVLMTEVECLKKQLKTARWEADLWKEMVMRYKDMMNGNEEEGVE